MLPCLDQDTSLQIAEFAAGLQTLSKKSSAREPSLEVVGAMRIALCLLALGGVVAQPPPEGPETPDLTQQPSGSKDDSAASSSGSSGEATWATAGWTSGSSGTGSYANAGYSSGSGWGNVNWGSVGGSGSGWDWSWGGGDSSWDPNSEFWHFRPSWNWDSPYPPDGTMYIENWGNPPTREVPSRRSFYLGAENGVSLAGATVEGGRADCGWRDWCVHLTFHSSYGVLSDFDAFVLDRYDSADRIYGDGLWYAREDEEGAPRAFAPLVLGGFSPEERAVLGNISSWRVEEMARRFNETRTTTWTLYPDSDEMDVVLSFKQLYTLLPGYPDGNVTRSSLNSEIITEWGPADQVLLRVTAKRQGSGATSSIMPRVLNFTGSQLFQVEYFSSLEYPQDDDGNLTASANAMTLDVVFSRRRYGSGLPWNPARPSDACDACNQRVMNHPVVARCLHGNVPERIFQDIYEQSANEQMEWDGGEWAVGDKGAPTNLSYSLNDMVDACFGLRWLLSGQTNDGSWSSSSGFPDAGDRRSASGSGFGDAGFGWSSPGSGSDGDFRYNDAGSSWSSEPVYRYDESGSRWSSWGYRDDGSASRFGDVGSRWSSSGSSGGPNVGDWPSVRDLRTALAIARETDAGIQCFVESRCPVGTRSFAEAAGRMVVLEHESAFVRVNFSEPSYTFYVWMELEGLGPETEFRTPELSSDNSPEEIAELVAGAVPNATEYNLAVGVQKFDNSEVIAWINMLNEWMANYYKSGGSESEASAAWAAYSSSADGGSSFQFPPVGEASGSGYYPNVGQQSHTDSVDGSSPDAGQDGGPARWWFGEPLPVPEPQFTVQISFRNVSVVPSIIEVIALSDESMDGDGKSKISFDYRGSELRFQLSPLNLTKFEYVPPPPYVNLTWDEDIPDYPDLYWNGSSIWNSTDIWSICSECEDAYAACDNSTSCSLGVRGFLEGALSPSRFDAYELSTETDSYNRRPWGVDFGPKLRQSASFFTAEGYDLYMNFMVCLKKPDCNLDLPRQAYNYSQGEYVTVEPTQLEVIPAESVFVVPTTTTGDLENLVMKFRGKEYVLEWANWTNEDHASTVSAFVANSMREYNEDSIWARNPSQNAWVNVDYESDYDRDGEYLGQLFRLRFEDNFFIDAEQPRFRPVSSNTYDELNTSTWKVNAYAYRNLYDEGIWDGYPLVTWRKLTNWLSDLGYNSSDFSRPLVYGDFAEEDINICHQCMDAWTQCISNPSCAVAMRQNVIYSMLYPMVYSNEPDQRSSMDFSARLALWRENVEFEVYASVLEFLSCLSKEACPVGYAFPSDPSESLVPVTTELVSHFAVNVPLDRAINAYAKDYSFEFVPGSTPTSDMESWLEAASNYTSDVKVQSSITNDDSIRFEVTYYPAVAAIPTFYFTDDATSLTLEGPMTFASLQLSSNHVQYGQSMSISLLESWFSAYLDTGKMFYSSVDIFRGTQVCHGCPECWEALTRCQNDMDCNASARDVLVPLLRNATLPVLTSMQSNGQTQVRLDLSLALLSLQNDAFQSREGWLAFAHLLRAISSCGCEVGFGYWGTSGYVEPTRVRIESDSVDVSVRLYPNTQLDVWFDGNIFSYSSDGASSPNDAANNFLNWFTTTANSEPFYLVVDHVDTIVDDMSQSATVTMKLYQVYDVDSESQPLVNPNWIPNFVVTSDDVSVVPPAEVTVTPWKIYLESVDRYPVFDRLLDLLEYGAISDEMPSGSSGSWGSSSNGNWAWSTSGSDASGSFSGDACARCADLRQACFDDMECQSAIGDYLLPTLETMSSWDTPDGFWYDMSSRILSNVFGQMQSPGVKGKLFALLTCSATEWTSTASQEGDSCVQLQAHTQYPDGNVSLDIIPAFSVFPISQGQGRTMYTGAGNPLYPMGTPVYYSDNGDAAELTDFMENQILGGYDSSGVRVKVSADWDSGMYNIIYDGLTATSTPIIEGETSSSTTQFKFFGSTPDLVGIFRPWMQWLDPTLSM